jgi:hypothetical protein
MKLRWPCRRWIFLWLGLGGVGIGILLFFSLPWLLIARLPTRPEQLPTADAIVHWAISPHAHADEWVVQLYQSGKAKKIVCASFQTSWDVYAADYVRQHLIELGVPAADVLTLHLPIEACAAPNTKRVAQFVKAQGWQRALVVVEPVGTVLTTRRIEKYFHQEGVEVTVSYAQKDREELVADWWKTHWKAQTIMQGAMSVVLDSFYSECW